MIYLSSKHGRAIHRRRPGLAKNILVDDKGRELSGKEGCWGERAAADGWLERGRRSARSAADRSAAARCFLNMAMRVSARRGRQLRGLMERGNKGPLLCWTKGGTDSGGMSERSRWTRMAWRAGAGSLGMAGALKEVSSSSSGPDSSSSLSAGGVGGRGGGRQTAGAALAETERQGFHGDLRRMGMGWSSVVEADDAEEAAASPGCLFLEKRRRMGGQGARPHYKYRY